MGSPLIIVGTGRLARAIGRLLVARGERVVAVAGQSPDWTAEAAAYVGPDVKAVTWREAAGLATRVLIATADRDVRDAARALAGAGLSDGVALHTCGAMGPEALEVLRSAGVAAGLFHPLQTVATADQGVSSLPGVTFGVCGDPAAVAWARDLAARLEGRVILLAPDQLPVYHAAAVMASNALTGVLDAAVALMSQVGVGQEEALEALAPLSRTALDNALQAGPRPALTGPVVRGDAATVALHVWALAAAPSSVRGLYVAAARHLIEVARRRGVAEDRLQAIAAALADLTGD